MCEASACRVALRRPPFVGPYRQRALSGSKHPTSQAAPRPREQAGHWSGPDRWAGVPIRQRGRSRAHWFWDRGCGRGLALLPPLVFAHAFRHRGPPWQASGAPLRSSAEPSFLGRDRHLTVGAGDERMSTAKSNRSGSATIWPRDSSWSSRALVSRSTKRSTGSWESIRKAAEAIGRGACCFTRAARSPVAGGVRGVGFAAGAGAVHERATRAGPSGGRYQRTPRARGVD